MWSRRDFIQFASISSALFMGQPLTAIAAKQKIVLDDILKFDSKGQLTLLHFTDIHGQLKPVYYRPPSENYGVGQFEGIPPHLVGERFLSHFNIDKESPLAYAHTMVDYLDLAKEYGRLGGLDKMATLIKAIRDERGSNNVLLLDGGDTWQGSYTSLMTQGMDMVSAVKLLKPDAMVGHWEFTFGKDRLSELLEKMQYPFLGGNVFDTEWEEPVYKSTAFFERGGIKVAVIGQHFPYTPISNPKHLVEGWSFGIRLLEIRKNIEAARKNGAEVVVLLSHNGFDVDQKIAGMIDGIDVILTGHTHDAIPQAIRIKNTLLLSSGSHGKYLGRIDLEIKSGKVKDWSSSLIPIFSDVVPSDKEVLSHINMVRAPFESECKRVIGKSGSLLYRRGNFNGTWDNVICDAIMENRDTEISLSPGFRWGTTLLPKQDITVDDLYSQTSINYPEVYRQEISGKGLKNILEDVCDNLFNPDPFYQQGGDMVRVGGVTYRCFPKAKIGQRISEIRLVSNGELIQEDKNYIVGGWGSINKEVKGPKIYNLLEDYIKLQDKVSPKFKDTVEVIGM
ncbi:MAG: thiosulfohydrolase SoxB [Paracoccaceae bacterium]